MESKIELWEELKFEVGSIGNELIPKDKRDILIGMGNRNAPVLFLGNDFNLYVAEDYKVAPKSSGEFLLKLLDITSITPDMYYITTLSKRGVKIKLFSEAEKKELKEILFMQIALINPKLIVLLGKEAAELLFEREINFDEERGNLEKWRGDIETLITYDVETVMNARKDEGKKSTVATYFWNDIKKIKERLGTNE